MNNPRILAVGCSNPENEFTQDEVLEKSRYNDNKFARRIFPYMGVKKRHLYIDRDARDIEDSNQRYDRYKKGSLEVACKSIDNCLQNYGYDIRDLGYLTTVSCTGYLCPGLSPRIMKALGLKQEIPHYDLQGMGCGAALPAIKAASEFVRNNSKKAMVTAVEICSTAYSFDESYDSITANAIFGDGAASVLIGKGNGLMPSIDDFESYCDTSNLEKLGFEYKDGLLKIILNEEIRNLAGPLVKNVVDKVLNRNNISKDDINFWMMHPGGKAILDNIKGALNINENALRHSRYVLENYGNMSSPSVLFVLNEVIKKEKCMRGNTGIMIGLGPGIDVYASLLRW